MPYTLDDFKPFFKSTEGTLGFVENEIITADKIVFWDDTELIGNAIVYINDAKIIKMQKDERREFKVAPIPNVA